MPRLPTWTVFRPIPGCLDFEVVGTVRAHTHADAVVQGRSLPGEPFYPIVCHAHVAPERVIVERPSEIATDRRNRRRAA